MKQTVTLNVRQVLIAAGVSGAVVAAYVIGSGGGAAQASSQTSSNNSGHIVMTGVGKVTGVPDELVASLSVDATASNVSTALANANSSLSNVLAALDKAGVARKDTQTTGLDIEPVYSGKGKGSPHITGYKVSEDLTVTIRSLPQAGSVLSDAVAAGGNDVRLHAIKLEISHQAALLKKARIAAVKDATEKANEYADASGATLGQVISIHEVGSTTPYVSLDVAASAHAPAAIPIRAGTSKLSATVSIDWQLS